MSVDIWHQDFKMSKRFDQVCLQLFHIFFAITCHLNELFMTDIMTNSLFYTPKRAILYMITTNDCY